MYNIPCIICTRSWTPLLHLFKKNLHLTWPHPFLSLMNNTYTNDNTAPQEYKVIIIHDHEVSGCNLISRIIHARSYHTRGINGDFKYDLSNLTFKQVKQLEEFHGSIISLHQEFFLSSETISPTRIIFHHMKALPNCDLIKNFIAPNIKYLIALIGIYGK